MVKRKLFILLIIATALQPFFSSFSHGSPIEAKVEIGLGGIQYLRKWLPLNIEIINKTNISLHGRIIASMEYQDSCSGKSKRLRSFTTDYQLNSNQKSIKKNLPIRLSDNTNLITLLVFNQDKLIYSKRIIPSPSNNRNNLILVLTKQQNDFNLLSTLKLPTTSIDVKLLFLKPSQFPETGIFLDSTVFIILDDIDLQEMSGLSLRALHEWGSRGGTLILTQRFLMLNYNNPWISSLIKIVSLKPIELNDPTSLSSFLGGQPDLVTKTKVIKLKSAADQVILMHHDIPLLAKKEYGLGSVIFMAFDLFNLSYSKPEKAYPLLRSAWSSILSIPISDSMGEWNREYTIPKQSDINHIKPKIKFYLFLLLVVLGPFNYWVLKKIDKREHILITIPVIAIIFSVGAIITGFSIRTPKSALVRVKVEMGQANSEQARVRTYVGLLASDTKSFMLTSAKDQYPTDLIEYKYNENEIVGRFPLEINFNSNSTSISKRRIPLWAMIFFRLDSLADYKLGINGKTRLNGNSLEGVITNDLTHTLKNSYLVYRTQHVKLGDLAPHESIDWRLPVNHPGIQLCRNDTDNCDSCTENHKMNIFLPELWRGESLSKSQLNILKDISRNYLNYFEHPVLIGWGDQTASNIKLDRADYFTQDQSVYLYKIPLFVDSRKINIPYGLAQRKVIKSSSCSSPYHMALDEYSPLWVRFDLPVSIHRPLKIKTLKLFLARRKNKNQSKELSGSFPPLKISAFDKESEIWHEVAVTKKESLEVPITPAKKFVSVPEGIVYVKIELLEKKSDFDFEFSYKNFFFTDNKAFENYFNNMPQIKNLDISFIADEEEI